MKTSSEHYMQRRTLGVIAFCCIAAAVAGCGKRSHEPAAVQASAPEAPVQAAVVPDPVVRNFDTKATKLPEDFNASVPTDVFDAITRVNTEQRGKFESEAKYMARMRALSGSVLYSQVRLDGGFAFRPTIEHLTIQYDADKEFFTFELRPDCVNDRNNCNAIEVENRSADKAEFPYINDYFAEKRKSVKHTKRIYLEAPTLRSLGYIVGRIKATPEAAKKMDGSLGILLVGRILPPFTSTHIDYPHDANEDEVKHQKIIRFSLEGVWLVNHHTRQILSKSWTIKKMI